MGERGMRSTSCWLGMIVMVALSSSVCASPLRLSLEECLRRALAANPDLLAARWDVRAAESRLAEAKAGLYPSASLTSLSGVVPGASGQVHEPPVTTVSEKGDLGPFTRVEVEFVQPIFTWGKLTAGRLAAAKGLEQEQAKGRQTRAEVVMEVKKLYYELLLARRISELLGEVSESFEKAIDVADERLSSGSGSVTQADVLKLKIGESAIAKEVLKARNGAELAREALARAIGVERQEDFDVADAVLEPLEADLRDLEHYVSGAFERSPEWKQVVAGLAAREAQLTMEESDYYPSIFIAGGFKYGYAPGRERQLSPFARDDFNVLELPGAALGLHWPLSFLQTRARVEGARAEVAKLRAQKRAAETGIALAVKKAYLEALQTREAVDIAERGRRSARGLLVTTVSGFELGVGEAKDVFESLIVYTRSTSDYYESVADYNVSLGKLTQVAGEEVAGFEY